MAFWNRAHSSDCFFHLLIPQLTPASTLKATRTHRKTTIFTSIIYGFDAQVQSKVKTLEGSPGRQARTRPWSLIGSPRLRGKAILTHTYPAHHWGNNLSHPARRYSIFHHDFFLFFSFTFPSLPQQEITLSILSDLTAHYKSSLSLEFSNSSAGHN